jgi:hypothetical protein
MKSKDKIGKAIDYMLAYSGGPAKLSQVSSADLVEVSDRWSSLAGGMVSFSITALEQTLQTRMDEEGCGAFFAAVVYPHVDVFSVAAGDTMSPVILKAVTGDMIGDKDGDMVTIENE